MPHQCAHWFAMTGLQELRHRTGSSGRPTPTRRLPVKSRRGRCPHRPGGTSPQKIRRAACPHAAARQAQRFPPSRQASTSAERVADGDAEAIRKQGANLHIPVRVAEGAGTVVTSVAERIPKPLVLAAFFPPFLSPQKEREPPAAWTDAVVLRIATASLRTGFTRSAAQDRAAG